MSQPTEVVQAVNPSFRSPYNRHSEPRGDIEFDHEAGGGAKQADAAETDINVIVDRWMKTGRVPTELNRGEPVYGDFTYGRDLKQAMERVDQALEAFLELPAKARAMADNDPAKFLELVQSEDDQVVRELWDAGVQVGEARPADPPPAPTEGGEPPEAGATPTAPETPAEGA